MPIDYWKYIYITHNKISHDRYILPFPISIVCSRNDNQVPGRQQAIIWISAGLLLIGPLGTNFSQILIAIHTFSFKKMHFKMSSGKWCPFCLGLNVLK